MSATLKLNLRLMSTIFQYGYQRGNFKIYANFKFELPPSAILNERHFWMYLT